MARWSRVRRARAVPVGVRRHLARGLVLVFLAGTVAACTGAPPRPTIQPLRAVPQPPEPPPDTIPEMLDYAGSLGVNIADMKKLPEGVLYDDVVVGSDSTVAAAGDSVEVGFDAWLPNGGQGDSGAGALRVGEGGIGQGVELAGPGMRPGGKRRLVLPPGLAYGPDGTETVPPNSVLVYDLELLRIIR